MASRWMLAAWPSVLQWVKRLLRIRICGGTYNMILMPSSVLSKRRDRREEGSGRFRRGSCIKLIVAAHAAQVLLL